jgi:hypothetical protein
MVAQKFNAAHELEAAIRILFARLTLVRFVSCSGTTIAEDSATRASAYTPRSMKPDLR